MATKKYLNETGAQELVNQTKSWATAQFVGASDVATAIAALDVTDAAVSGKYVSAVSETDGKIAVTRADIPVTAVSAATGSTNGTITVTVNGTDTSVAVKGLASAAYTDSSAYDAAGAADTALESAKEYTDSAVSSAYKVKGSCAFDDLPALSSAKVGDVWNVTEAFTTTEDFVEGSGGSYPAGTNVCRVNVSGSAKWDCLSGIYDMSGYLLASDLVAMTTAEVDALFA